MKLLDFQERAVAAGIPMLLLRLLLGFGFAAHGWAKLSRGPDAFGNILTSLGVPLPYFMAWVTTLVELIGGVLLMAGAFVIVLGLPLAVTMLTAMFAVHLQYGFSSIKLKSISPEGAQFGPPGYEVNLLYLVGLLVLVLGGSGKWSVDEWIGRKKTKLRIARATNDLKRVSTMYLRGLGLTILGSFKDHAGFDGIILGAPDVDYHFEFTYERGQTAPRSNSPEQLIVFYTDKIEQTEHLKNQMLDAGFEIVKSHNPYWDQYGYTFKDFEDYRVVICHRH